MERIESVNKYYESYDEDSRLRDKKGSVEFLTTVNYIEKYLTEGAKILEIGAGTGRYSHYFAQKGYLVDAIELTQHNIEIFKRNTKPKENVTITQGDAISLDDVPSEKYDITLVLGPMYHLYTEKDQLKALSEAIRVTKRGGVLFVAYCNNDTTVYQYGFIKGNFKNGAYDKMLDSSFKLSSNPDEIFSLYRKEDIDKLMSNFNVTRLHYLGTDLLTKFISDQINQMDEDLFKTYVKYVLTICERPDMLGTSFHLLDVFKRN